MLGQPLFWLWIEKSNAIRRSFKVRQYVRHLNAPITKAGAHSKIPAGLITDHRFELNPVAVSNHFRAL